MSAPPPAQFESALPLTSVAWQSWRSLRPAVMAWLWTLNVLYWIAFAWLPRAEACWALIAYFAVGPIILVMIRTQRGLTRLAGLIHLPWLPFTVYLGLRLFSDVLGPPVSPADGLYYGWLLVLLASTLVCLALDAVDVLRWLAGERYVLGTPAAAAAGASRIANGPFSA